MSNMFPCFGFKSMARSTEALSSFAKFDFVFPNYLKIVGLKSSNEDVCETDYSTICKANLFCF